jgi:hypothetical protein
MVLFAGKRSRLVALLRGFGPPPPAPRRHFSKCWGYGDERLALEPTRAMSGARGDSATGSIAAAGGARRARGGDGARGSAG